jgi:hypothetical protein
MRVEGLLLRDPILRHLDQNAAGSFKAHNPVFIFHIDDPGSPRLKLTVISSNRTAKILLLSFIASFWP